METLESASTDPATLSRGSRGPLDQIQHVLHRYPVISPTFVLLASCVVFTMLGDGRFQRPETIGIILQQTAVLSTLAIGQTLIILTAGVDLAPRCSSPTS
jgi:fructose transport system permease protein